MNFQFKYLGPSRAVSVKEDFRKIDFRIRSLLREKQDDEHLWSPPNRDRTDSGHRVFQYPAMMVPIVQRRLLEAVVCSQREGISLYDPFCGSGTSLVSGMHLGMSVHGNDINPLAVLISRLRTAREVDADIAEKVRRAVSDARGDKSQVVETAMPNREKWFKQEVALELSALRRSIRNESNLWMRRLLWTTLAETIRLTSNDRTSTYKLHVRTEEDINRRDQSPIDEFERLAAQNAKSLLGFRAALNDNGFVTAGKYLRDTVVKLADTTETMSGIWGSEKKFDLMMTSPPYGDNVTTVTYGQHSYLPLNWIDLADIDEGASPDFLKSTREIDQRSLGGGKVAAKRPDPSRLLEGSRALKKAWAKLPSGGTGRQRLMSFYADVTLAIDSMLSVMKQDAYLIWTVGNRNISGCAIPTDKIITELLEARGCTYVAELTRVIRHKRMPNRNASSETMKREHILVLRHGE
ncbi:hypothetical protein HHL28_03905 [Aerophototrophica crusticola]|uniref:site-specific DNA-methyltransferase (cytosine-N(4)-specific) n=1 Tax=Aerophototrophica crusticola TaxID=1709002 RepID=A0A858R4N4_9PROT|nr:hypothetical protein HHL28_03905 [Rhodospirillaceae bacterium B3]